LSDLDLHNVESQRADPDSMLTLARDLIGLRRRTPDLQTGDYETLETPDTVWAWRRGERASIVVNMSDLEATLGRWEGTIALGTDRRRDGEAVTGTLRLGAWEAVVTLRA
jgi:glycosidase